ncbi:MAG: hypothetical protein IJB22_03810 [Clostridia bacterium]|nr:hypothetical protein [Clostridia bacterium]
MRKKKRKFVAKNKSYTFIRLAILLGILLAVIAIAVGIVLLVKNRSAFGSVAELPFTADDPYVYNSSGFHYIKDGNLCFHDPAHPDKDTSLALNGENITLIASDSITALYSGAALHIVGAADMIDVGGEILSASCGKNHAAVLRKDAAGEAAILVYDSTGLLTDTISEQQAMLLDCGFGSLAGSDMLYVLSMSDSGSVPVSTITTYTYGENGAAMSGVITLHNELVEDVYFASDSIFVAGTAHLQRYDKEFTAKAYSLLTYGDTLLDVSDAGDKPLFLYADRAEQAALTEENPVPSSVRLLRAAEAELSDAVDRTVALPEGAHSCFAIGGRFMVFTKDTVYTYSASGTLSDTTTLEIPCDEAVKLSDSCILLRRGPEMRILNLR